VTRSVPVRDDLFVATIPPLRVPEHPPWPASSTFYPAAFGGALAGAAILIANSARLGMSTRYRLAVVAVAAVALVGRMWLLRSGLDLTGLYGATTAAEGAAVYLCAARAQNRAFRVYELREHSPTSSLVGPGLAAVAFGWVLEGIVAVFVLGSA
jgi:hypothetical protein